MLAVYKMIGDGCLRLRHPAEFIYQCLPHLSGISEAQILTEEADAAGREIADPPDDAADVWYGHQSRPPEFTSGVRDIAFCHACATTELPALQFEQSC